MPKRRALWPMLSGLLLTLTLALAACGIGNATPSIAGGPAFAGSVTDGILADPDSLLPEGSTQHVAAQVDAALWAPLFYGDNQGMIQPGLAQDVPSTQNGGISASGLTYTIRMRPDLHWSDGSALTSKDVAFTLALMRDPEFGAKTAPALFQEIASIATPDPSTVVLTLQAQDVTFLANALTDPQTFAPLPRSVYGTMPPATVLGAAHATPKVVSGPFMVQSRTPGNEIALVRNPNYYRDPRPYLNQITFKIYSDQAALLAALQAGTLDLASSLDVADLASYKAIMGKQVVMDATATTYEAIYFNETNPLLADANVRKAITEAIDTRPMMQTIWQGIATPTCDGQVGTFAYDPSLIPCYTHDIAKAKTALAASGWRMGSDGYVQHKGQTLTLRYATVRGDAQRAAVAQLIAQQLRTVGIKLTVTMYTPQTYASQVLSSYKAYDIADAVRSTGYDPDTHTQWACKALTSNGGANISHYCNSEVDAALTKELATPDQATRLAAFKTIQHDLLRDAPVMYLFAYPNIACAPARLHNYAPSGFGTGDTWNVWDWYLI